MDFAYSPSHIGGGTLHLSPSHAHHQTPAVARNLRRSLSRSPSKSRQHHLYAPSQPARYSATAPSTPSALNSRYHSPTDDFQLPSAKKPRPTLRRTSPLSSISHTSTPSGRSLRRALSDNSDNGNASSSPAGTPPEASGALAPDGQENCSLPLVQQPSSSSEESLQKSPLANFGSSPKVLSNKVPVFRPVHRGWRTVKSSPLKRSDALVNLSTDPPGSPSAKRRTICGSIVSSPFGTMPGERDHDMSDRDTEESDDYDDDGDDSSQDMPLRSSLFPRRLKLRRSKAFVRPLDGSSQLPAPRSLELTRDSPRRSRSSSRNRSQTHNSAAFSPNRSQPLQPGFTDLSDTSRSNNARPARAQPHPLSKILSPTSPTSSSLERFAPHGSNSHFQQSPSRPPLDFSKSLPISAIRPIPDQQSHEDSAESQESGVGSLFATPKFYHITKPDPAAFQSTGLISKKHRNPDEIPPPPAAHPGMPDTPCKRVQGAFTFSTSPTPTNSVVKEQRLSQPSFGTPSKSFGMSTHQQLDQARQDSNLFGSLERPTVGEGEGFLSNDGDEAFQCSQTQTESQSSADELPPTPTKQILGASNGHKHNSLRSALLGRKPSISPNTFIAPGNSELEQIPNQSSSFLQPLSTNAPNGSVPQTPVENTVPDPSGLSISPGLRKVTSPITNGGFAKPSGPITPATPTHRDGMASFNFCRPLMTPSNHAFAQDLDPVLSRRFKKVEWYGRGHFSEVYKVCESQEPNTMQSYFSSFRGSSAPQTPILDRVFIVKRTKMPYTSMKIRHRKLREAAIMSALGKSDHVVQLIDSWESACHIYIQTEFCEEGSLEQFLAKIGIKGRLDDFRIWKIMIELAEGVKHIHDHGFIHLDLKPANVFIDFAGVLKIGDFGLATEWPAPANVEGEGDRRYMGPDLLQGSFDKPADIFALGMMMFEIAGNCELPDNGTYWQHLRSGNWSDLPSLTSSSSYDTSLHSRDNMSNGTSSHAWMDVKSHESLYDPTSPRSKSRQDSNSLLSQQEAPFGKTSEQPRFMQDPEDPEALEQIVHWMMQPKPEDRPVIDQILQAGGCRWVDDRRRAGAVVFEGAWGPPSHVLACHGEAQEDEEMMDAP